MDSNFSYYSFYIFQGAALGITAAATPGPFQTFLINQTLASGWRRSLPLPFAPLVSDPPIILAALLLIDQLPENFNQILNLAGGVFIFFIVWGLWREFRKKKRSTSTDFETENTSSTVNEKKKQPWRIVWKGALMNLLSPGPYMFWGLVLGPILLQSWQISSLHALSFLFAFYFSLIGGMLGIVFLFHQTRRLGERVIQYLVLISIFILLIFGIYLIIQGLHFP